MSRTYSGWVRKGMGCTVVIPVWRWLSGYRTVEELPRILMVAQIHSTTSPKTKHSFMILYTVVCYELWQRDLKSRIWFQFLRVICLWMRPVSSRGNFPIFSTYLQVRPVSSRDHFLYIFHTPLGETGLIQTWPKKSWTNLIWPQSIVCMISLKNGCI